MKISHISAVSNTNNNKKRTTLKKATTPNFKAAEVVVQYSRECLSSPRAMKIFSSIELAKEQIGKRVSDDMSLIFKINDDLGASLYAFYKKPLNVLKRLKYSFRFQSQILDANNCSVLFDKIQQKDPALIKVLADPNILVYKYNAPLFHPSKIAEKRILYPKPKENYAQGLYLNERNVFLEKIRSSELSNECIKSTGPDWDFFESYLYTDYIL